MTGDTCQLDSVFPTIVTWCYGSIYLAVFISFTIYSFLTTKRAAKAHLDSIQQTAKKSAIEQQRDRGRSGGSIVSKRKKKAPAKPSTNINENNDSITSPNNMDVSSQQLPDKSVAVTSALTSTIAIAVNVASDDDEDDGTNDDKKADTKSKKTDINQPNTTNANVKKKNVDIWDEIEAAQIAKTIVPSSQNISKTEEMLMKLYNKNSHLRKDMFLKLWIYDIWKKKKCYLPLLTHTIDQMTDVGVIVAFGLLYKKESNIGSDYCPSINPLSLLIFSLISFWLYRIIASMAIYFQTKSYIRIIYQIFDLELYRALFINYKLNTDIPSNPQRWIQSLEAVFEAFPQTLIQLFYVTKTNSFDPLIVFSLIWSLWAIITKTANEDKIFFTFMYQKGNYHCLSLKYWRKGKCVSWGYVARLVYRAGDVLWRVFTLLLVWVFIGGFGFTIIVLLETAILVSMARKTKEFCAFVLFFCVLFCVFLFCVVTFVLLAVCVSDVFLFWCFFTVGVYYNGL